MLTDLLFPKKCLSCGSKGYYICKACIKHQSTKPQRCIVCEKNSIDGLTHFKCKRKLLLDGVVSIWAYDGVVRKALIGLKYRFANQIAMELACASVNYLKNNITALPKRAILIPIPLHKSRENWRGFNQSAEIGKFCAKLMGWKYSSKLICKKVKTIPQAGLLRQKRKENLKNVFEFNKIYKSVIAQDVAIVLFDDVCTTGTTLKEGGKVLKRAGFRTVWGLTIAR